jgi:predicted amidohydrolase
MIVSPDGKILKELGKREGVITTTIDPKKPLKLRKTIPSIYYD